MAFIARVVYALLEQKINSDLMKKNIFLWNCNVIRKEKYIRI